jgi:hypothetical protein
MAKDEPDYIGSDCPMAGHHIAQGMQQAGTPAKALQHPLTWCACLRARLSRPDAHLDYGLHDGVEDTAMTITRDSLLTLEAYARSARAASPRPSRTASCAACAGRAHDAAVRGRADHPPADPGDAAHREDLRRGRHPGEIDAYAPLVPDGSNWKATMLIEYPDVHERKRELARLIGVEDRMFVEVEGHARVYAIADEDLDRENDEKTSAVHFVRFEFSATQREAIRAGAAVKMGCDHTNYPAHPCCCHRRRDAGQPGGRPSGWGFWGLTCSECGPAGKRFNGDLAAPSRRPPP